MSRSYLEDFQEHAADTDNFNKQRMRCKNTQKGKNTFDFSRKLKQSSRNELWGMEMNKIQKRGGESEERFVEGGKTPAMPVVIH